MTNTSQSQNPLASFLAVPGAKTTLPVSAAKAGVSADFVAEARQYFENFHYQMGGDHALYYNLRLSEFLPTAMALPACPVKELAVALDPRVGQVKFTPKEGEMTLDEYVVHPNHRVQGLLIAHHGKIVCEAYPGMNPEDHHIWMSAAKTTVGLVFAQLAEEGKVDIAKSVVDYVPELQGTNWDGITVLNALNMSLGLELEETLQALIDPDSLIVRFFSAEFGQPAPGATQIEHWLDVLKEAQNLEDEAQGTVMRYCSGTTTLLNHMAEKIENKPWIDIFSDRVWSKLGARGPVMINLTPEGTAVAHGLVATTLQDFARFGIAFTPSWETVAHEPIVSPTVLQRLQTGGSPEAAYKAGATFAGHRENFGEDPMTNSWQFDDVFADGAMFKHGNVGQGIYIDPSRDVVGVYFSTNPYIPPYGEDKMAGFIRRAAKLLAGD
jgi:CubicO group peptidase (beta-lactamase class C family)